MKRTLLATITTIYALPATAHQGTHLHPHGVEVTMAGALTALGAVAVMFAMARLLVKGRRD